MKITSAFSLGLVAFIASGALAFAEGKKDEDNDKDKKPSQIGQYLVSQNGDSDQPILFPAPCREAFAIQSPDPYAVPSTDPNKPAAKASCNAGLPTCDFFKPRAADPNGNAVSNGHIVIEIPTIGAAARAGASGATGVTGNTLPPTLIDLDVLIEKKIDLLASAGRDVQGADLIGAATVVPTPTPNPSESASTVTSGWKAPGKVVKFDEKSRLLWDQNSAVCRLDKFEMKGGNSLTLQRDQFDKLCKGPSKRTSMYFGCVDGDDENFEQVCYDFSTGEHEMGMLRGLYLKTIRDTYALVKQELKDSAATDGIPKIKVFTPVCQAIAISALESYSGFNDITVKAISMDVTEKQKMASSCADKTGEEQIQCLAQVKGENPSFCEMDPTQFSNDCVRNPGARSCNVMGAQTLMLKSFTNLVTCEVEGRAREYFRWHFQTNFAFFHNLVKAEATACRNFAEESAGGFFDDDEARGKQVLNRCWTSNSDSHMNSDAHDAYRIDEQQPSFGFDPMLQDVYLNYFFNFKERTYDQANSNKAWPFVFYGADKNEREKLCADGSSWEDYLLNSLGGAGAGGYIGQAIGTVMLGPIGTVVGGIIGAAVGGTAGAVGTALSGTECKNAPYLNALGRSHHNDRLRNDGWTLFLKNDFSRAYEGQTGFGNHTSRGEGDKAKDYTYEEFFFALDQDSMSPWVKYLVTEKKFFGAAIPNFRSSEMSQYDDDDMEMVPVLIKNGKATDVDVTMCRDSLGIIVTGAMRDKCCNGEKYIGGDGCPANLDEVIVDDINKAEKDIEATQSALTSLDRGIGGLSNNMGATNGQGATWKDPLANSLSGYGYGNMANAVGGGNGSWNGNGSASRQNNASANDKNGGKGSGGFLSNLAGSLFGSSTGGSNGSAGSAGGISRGTTPSGDSAAATAGAGQDRGVSGSGYSGGGQGGMGYGGGGGGSENSVGSVEGMSQFGGKDGASASAEGEGMIGSDPDDYFNRTSKLDNLFRRAEKVYSRKSQGWALDEANEASAVLKKK